MVGGHHGAVPVQADEAQGDDGCGAEHDIKGDPDFAEELPKQPHPCHLVNDAARGNGWESVLKGLISCMSSRLRGGNAMIQHRGTEGGFAARRAGIHPQSATQGALVRHG